MGARVSFSGAKPKVTDGPFAEAKDVLGGYWIVRGDLLARLARHEEARLEFERAAALTRNGRERKLLLDRAAACGGRPPDCDAGR